MYTPNLRSLLPSQTEKLTSRHAAQKQHQRARSEFVLRRPQACNNNNNIDAILDLFFLPAILETVVLDEIALVPLPMGVGSRF
jgi:hypothetical protein